MQRGKNRIQTPEHNLSTVLHPMLEADLDFADDGDRTICLLIVNTVSQAQVCRFHPVIVVGVFMG